MSSYTKANLIDLAMIKISGGQLSPDVKVERVDIAAYLPAAVNYAVTKEARIRKREARMDGLLTSFQEAIDPDFVTTHCVKVLCDDKRDASYIALPKKLQFLPKNAGLKEVSPVQGNTPFHKSSRFSAGYVTSQIGQITTYWFEQYPSEHRVYFSNLSPIVEDVLVHMIASIDDIGENEIVPIPAGMEVEVIDLLVEFSLGIRSIPQDNINDNSDGGNTIPNAKK